MDVHDEIIKNRVIMNFKQEGTRTEQVLKSVEAMITFGKFAAETIIVDGYDFTRSGCDDLARFKEFAAKLGLEVWFSASLKETGDPSTTPTASRSCSSRSAPRSTSSSPSTPGRPRRVQGHQGPRHPAPGVLPIKLDPKTLLIQ